MVKSGVITRGQFDPIPTAIASVPYYLVPRGLLGNGRAIQPTRALSTRTGLPTSGVILPYDFKVWIVL